MTSPKMPLYVRVSAAPRAALPILPLMNPGASCTHNRTVMRVFKYLTLQDGYIRAR